MDAKVYDLTKWKEEHPPIVDVWQSCYSAQIRCWFNWSRLWFPWLKQ